MDSNARGVAEVDAREIVKKISDAAIELAFVRHELTTTEYEDEDYPDVEEGVEAFKALVEEVKTDVFACLTGDEEGCLDPEDVDNDNELEWLKRQLRVNSYSALQAQNKLLREALEFYANPANLEQFATTGSNDFKGTAWGEIDDGISNVARAALKDGQL